jgi:hypothetical protein
MIKKSIAIVLLCIIAGCSSIDKMNDNMQQSNALMLENARVMNTSLATIGTNTEEVRRSTETMQAFQSTIEESSSLLQRTLGQLSAHPLFFPMAFLSVLLLLVLPSGIFYFAFWSLNKQIRPLLKKKSGK